MANQNKSEMAAVDKSGEVQQKQSRPLTPFDEMERIFESFFPRGWMRPMRWEWPEWSISETPFTGLTPKVDLVERDKEIVIRAELPGVDKDNLDISLTDDSVTINATTSKESEEEKGDYHRREISRGSFSRTLALPSAVKADDTKASFKDGVLELILQKQAPAKRHSIKVE